MKRPDFKTVPCLYCGGKGINPGDDTGEVLRREREEKHVPRISKGKNPELGLAHHFGYSESYVLDLEGGDRAWSWALVHKYRKAIDATVRARMSFEKKHPGKAAPQSIVNKQEEIVEKEASQNEQ